MAENTIHAEGKIVGRLASQIAMILRGKMTPDFLPNRAGNEKVVVLHTDRMRVTGGSKPLQKMYRRHSGYLGHLKEETLEHLMKRDSRQVLRHAVSGMLPKNRLRARMLKNLILHKGEAR